MILDTQNLFSDSQAVTATADSTNIIDLGADRDLGVDTEIDFLVDVVTAFTASGAATMTIALQTDTDPAFGTAVTLYTTAAIGKATLVAGYAPIKIKLPQTVRRYLKVVYTVATGPMTAGKVTAGLLKGMQNWKAFSAPNQA